MIKYQMCYRRKGTTRWLKTDHKPFSKESDAWKETYYLMEQMPKYTFTVEKVKN